MITLHGNSISPFVRKVLAVLQLKNIAFEQTQQMPFTADTEFVKISPLGKIPALQDGDTAICDSRVICEYLNDAYPHCPVYPSDPKEKAKARSLGRGGGGFGQKVTGHYPEAQRILRGKR